MVLEELAEVLLDNGVVRQHDMSSRISKSSWLLLESSSSCCFCCFEGETPILSIEATAEMFSALSALPDARCNDPVEEWKTLLFVHVDDDVVVQI